jgi:hypothetical protein
MSTTTQPQPSEKKEKKARSKPVEDEILLVALGKSPDGKQDILIPLPAPEGVDFKNPKHRNARVVRAAVKSAMEKGGNALQNYSGKKLRVAFLGETFSFSAKVEEVKVTKVTVSES